MFNARLKMHVRALHALREDAPMRAHGGLSPSPVRKFRSFPCMLPYRLVSPSAFSSIDSVELTSWPDRFKFEIQSIVGIDCGQPGACLPGGFQELSLEAPCRVIGLIIFHRFPPVSLTHATPRGRGTGGRG